HSKGARWPGHRNTFDAAGRHDGPQGVSAWTGRRGSLLRLVGGAFMSRIGKVPIPVPAGVKVEIADGNAITVAGPKGTLHRTFPEQITFAQSDGTLLVTRPDDSKTSKALHGLSRTLLANMVQGVKDGFTKSLELQGVGYRVAKVGENLVFQ